MARSRSATARTTREPVLCRDRFIDKSYIKDGKSGVDYLKAPLDHSKDSLASYLSLRFAAKDDFMKQLKNASPKDWERVDHEIERIRLDRQKFRDNPKKQALNTELQKSYESWRTTILNPSELHRIKIEREKQVRKLPFNDAHKSSLNGWDSKHLKQLEYLVNEEHPAPVSGRVSRSHSTSHKQPVHSNAAKPPQSTVQAPQEYGTDDPYHGFRAGALYFKKRPDGTLKGITSENEKYKDTKFPNQKIALKDILDNPDNNPLSEKRPNDEVRYFHFPSNNMEWIEKAIKQYYSKRNAPTKDGEMLLSREYWTGQMHGGGPVDYTNDARRTTPVHSRHMRTKCSLVPRDLRPRFQKVNQRGISPHPSRRAEMVKVVNEAIGTDSKTHRRKLLLPQAVDEALKNEALKKKKSKNGANTKHKVVERKQHLARYLFAVARMAEEIDYAADEKLLREKVNIHSPLHVRRTLDQYYFLTLDNTSERDRDQVVYRGTRSLSSTTRVVMVDQLWMWILDDNTIITSFPRRWGRNKPDPSGVHKSLRVRLGQRREVIKSIHHLAMIIMDQCSRVFFDRTQPLDQRPEVMDLFAAAIGTVTEKTRIAYDHFWRSIGQDQHYKGQLVINPEGIVLKEAQDIVEELMIMKRVYCEQIKVAKEFMRHLTHPHGRHAAMSGDALLINKFISELKKTMAKDIEDDDYDTLDLETRIDEESVHEAHDLIELLQARLEEITDLEEAAMRACTQLEGLLSLKQQQASIVDARAALDTANESYKQGRTIQAFTIVTIVFLPLGFIAAFFGMNNVEINDAPWMSLWQQIKWMFGGTAVVIFISISLAFGSWFRDLTAWIRAVLRFAFQVPWAKLSEGTEITIVHDWWKNSLFNSKNLDRKRESVLADISRKKREKQYILQQETLEKDEDEEEEDGYTLRRASRLDLRPKRNNMKQYGWDINMGDHHVADDQGVDYKRILQQIRPARLGRRADDLAV